MLTPASDLVEIEEGHCHRCLGYMAHGLGVAEERRVFAPRGGDNGSSTLPNGGRGKLKAEPHSSQLGEAGDLQTHLPTRKIHSWVALITVCQIAKLFVRFNTRCI